jgi:hypothetical protein
MPVQRNMTLFHPANSRSSGTLLLPFEEIDAP